MNDLVDVSVPADQRRDAGGHCTAPDEASNQPHDGLQSLDRSSKETSAKTAKPWPRLL